MVSPSDALSSSSLSSCLARASISWTRASIARLFSCSPASSSTAGVVAASATGVETSWPGDTGEAAISANTRVRPVAEKASIELWSLRFMVNVLLWVIGVVCNYNTKTRRVNEFLSDVDPTEVMVWVDCRLLALDLNKIKYLRESSSLGECGSAKAFAAGGGTGGHQGTEQ